MIAWPTFEATVREVLERDIGPTANRAQRDAIRAPASDSLFIVAGPGSGKTTVIALRVLKLILVDKIDPAAILATTFTRRAAAELRSRILGWGDTLRRAFINSGPSPLVASELRALDFNRARSGTIDSIAEELLTEFRPPGVGAPVVLEAFVARALMLRVGLFNGARHRSPPLRGYVAGLMGTSFRLDTPRLSGTMVDLNNRFLNDQVDVAQFCAAPGQDPGVQIACAVVSDYVTELQARHLYDFARLSSEFLGALRGGVLQSFLASLKFVLVDEYQDTNLLQEQIYFQLANAALVNGGSFAVVGDDDQSLYRFRGATVEIFQAFPTRSAQQIGVQPRTVHLSQNYRSTNMVVSFVRDYVSIDPMYQRARVANKPAIAFARMAGPTRRVIEYPVLGMFRDTREQLAIDLAQFIHQVVHGPGFMLGHGRGPLTIRLSPQGSPADVAFLSSSPLEFSSGGATRLPLLLRRELDAMTPATRLFNPRGQSLQNIDSVQRLCGLVLECIDPGATVQNAIQFLPNEVARALGAWRLSAQTYATRGMPPADRQRLQQFTHAWSTRTALGTQLQRRADVSINDLIYKLVTWIRPMQDDVENLVYLEAITRTVTQSGLFGDFGGEVIFEPGTMPLSRLATASVREAIWNIFSPIASGAVELNEDLFETLPADRISVMSIHQAKGLEFPLVIVDVGSDFATNHPAQAFRRYPRTAGMTCALEDEVRRFSPLGHPTRSGLDRAFDDLVRQYFVAYSRAQDVLLLVGHGQLTTRIQNIATGWTRRGHWTWGAGLPNLVHV